MRKLSFFSAVGIAVLVVAVGPASAQTSVGASGQVRMTAHTHSAGTLLFPTDRLSYNPTTGETFAYSSRLCSGNAPYNDIGLDFIPDYPGVDDDADHTARVRHGVFGTITGAYGTRGTLTMRIVTVLCVPGNSPNGFVESGHSIVSYFTGTYTRTTPNILQVYGAFQFSPRESTGTFRDIRGGGQLYGRITCLSSSCAAQGEFTDFVATTGETNLPPGVLTPGMLGSYYDPTILPVP